MLYNKNESPTAKSKYNVYSSTTLQLHKRKNSYQVLPLQKLQKGKNQRLNTFRQKFNLNQIKLKIMNAQQFLKSPTTARPKGLSPDSAIYRNNKEMQSISPTRTEVNHKAIHSKFMNQNALMNSWSNDQQITANNNSPSNSYNSISNKQQRSLFSLKPVIADSCILESKTENSLRPSLSSRGLMLSKSEIVKDQDLQEIDLAQSIEFMPKNIQYNQKKRGGGEQKEAKGDQQKTIQVKKGKYLININKSMQLLQMYQSMRAQNKNPKGIQRKNKININGFCLGPMIGKGKFGKVHIAEHIETNFIVALKIIPKQIIKQHKMQEQLKKEIKLHLSLDHPNIIKCYGFFSEKDDFYLILEYMNNGTLFDRLKKVGQLQVKEAVDYLKDIIQALEYLHDLNIAHRDLKPENIVLAEGNAKICDFGWSSAIINMRSTYCGTLQYASPEILSRQTYGLQVDIWSLGILMYEMLMGRSPFRSKDKQTTKQAIINSENVELSYNSDIPQEAKQLIELLLQKNQSKRYLINQILEHRFFAKYNKK